MVRGRDLIERGYPTGKIVGLALEAADLPRRFVHCVPARTSPVAVTFQLRRVTSIQQKCCILVQMIPQFTDEWLLPPGVHGTDLEELKEKIGWSRKRQGCSKGLKRLWS